MKFSLGLYIYPTDPINFDPYRPKGHAFVRHLPEVNPLDHGSLKHLEGAFFAPRKSCGSWDVIHVDVKKLWVCQKWFQQKKY